MSLAVNEIVYTTTKMMLVQGVKCNPVKTGSVSKAIRDVFKQWEVSNFYPDIHSMQPAYKTILYAYSATFI